MKSLFKATFLCLSVAASYAQGQVVFANKVGNIVDAPVFYAGTQFGPGPNYSAQLYLQDSRGALTPLTPTSVFRPAGTGAAAIADRYWVNQTVDVPRVNPGENATFLVRIWQTSMGDFDRARANGAGWAQSAPFTVAVGGGILPPANLTTLQSFSISIPEPSAVVLGIIGASALFLQRKRFKGSEL